MKEISINIPSSAEFIGPVVKFFYAFFADKSVEEGVATSVVTSVIEAVGNAIVHGNKEDARKKIDISVHIHQKTIKITVRDEGKGFDVDSIPDPRDPENLLKLSGRGIFLIRSFMDSVAFNSNGKGSTITMEKALPQNLE